MLRFPAALEMFHHFPIGAVWLEIVIMMPFVHGRSY